MTVYQTIEEFLEAAHSIVPFSMAATYLNLSIHSIQPMVSRGELAMVRVEEDGEVWKGITIGSLLGAKKKREVSPDEIAKVDVILREQGGELINYGDLMDRIGLSYRNPHHRSRIGAILGAVSRLSYGKEGYMLSVLAVQKGTQRPNAAFYDLAREILDEADDMEDEDIFRQQRKLLRKALK
ncbi:MAG: hypothetical protein FD119_2576 [Stygiobacter sp.]|nr:MAG: hypothetical protein FD119_2576 [Stygiobacter sp.]